eukprot:gene7719-9493_t
MIAITIQNYKQGVLLDPDFSILTDFQNADDKSDSYCSVKNNGMSKSKLAGIIIGSVLGAFVGIVQVFDPSNNSIIIELDDDYKESPQLENELFTDEGSLNTQFDMILKMKLISGANSTSLTNINNDEDTINNNNNNNTKSTKSKSKQQKLASETFQTISPDKPTIHKTNKGGRRNGVSGILKSLRNQQQNPSSSDISKSDTTTNSNSLPPPTDEDKTTNE